MNDIKRYSVGGFLGDGVISNAGRWVTFEDYEKRVNGQLRLLEVSDRYNEKLEARIAELEAEVKTLNLMVKISGDMLTTDQQYDVMCKVNEGDA